MNRNLIRIAAILWMVACSASFGDVVTDWNDTLRNVMQHDGLAPAPMANPGWATRTMAMLNGSIYDIFQAFDRTHAPFLVDAQASSLSVSRDAAVHAAAYEILSQTYPGEASLFGPDRDARLATIADGPAKSAGIALGQSIAGQYLADRSTDHSGDTAPYTETNLPGRWRSDPFHPGQEAWGAAWGRVTPFAIASTDALLAQLPPVPALDSPKYAAAYQQVKELGAINSAARQDDQTEMAIFWGYDRATMGPPPVLFNRNLSEIAIQAGNSPQQNARLFAMASVAMADAAISAWDGKFRDDFWRPVTAIHEGTLDPDPTWRPLGAPGDPMIPDSDFTPPFPAWPSGHATMGGALYETLRLFYGTNVFDEIDGEVGNDPQFELTSAELTTSDVISPPDNARQFTAFSAMLDSPNPLLDAPEWENAVSRIYLGIHWIFDAEDGVALGNLVAREVSAGYFQPVPEPSTVVLAACGLGLLAWRRRRKHRPRGSNR